MNNDGLEVFNNAGYENKPILTPEQEIPAAAQVQYNEGVNQSNPLNILTGTSDSSSIGKESRHITDDVPENSFWTGGKEWSAGEVVGEGTKTSMAGTAMRVGYEQGSWLAGFKQMLPSWGTGYIMDDEDLQKVQELDMPPESLTAVVKGAKTKEEFVANLKVVHENVQVQRKHSEYGLLGGIVGGIGDAIGDPTSYVGGMFGRTALAGGKLINQSLVGKLADSAVTAGLSEAFLRNSVTGQEADIGGAIVGGMVFTGALHGAGKGLGYAFQPNASMTRTEGSMTSFNTGKQDPTFMANHDGTSKVVDLGNGEKAEITESGYTVSAGLVPPKAATNHRGTYFNDTATVAARADSEEIRKFAAQMSRPVQGYKEGFTHEGPRVDIVARNLTTRSNSFALDIQESLDDIVGRNVILGGKLQERRAIQSHLRDVIEGRAEADSPDIAKLATAIQDEMELVYNLTQNPAQIHGGTSKPMIKGAGNPRNYLPRVYNRNKTNLLVNAHGRENVHQALQDSLYNGYHSAPNKADLNADILADFNVKGKPEVTEVTEEMLKDYIQRKTYGIIDNNSDDGGAVFNTDIFMDADVGNSGRNVDHLKSRINIPFGDAKLGDTDFRISDILDDNLEQNLSSYMQQMNAELSVQAVYGKSMAELKSEIGSLNATSIADKEAKEALVSQLKLLAGESRRAYGLTDMLSDTLRNATFTNTGAMFAPAQIAEVASNIATAPKVVAGTLKNIAKVFGQDVKRIVNMKPDELKSLGDIAHGANINKRIGLTKGEFTEQLAKRAGRDPNSKAFRALASVQFMSAKMSEKTPWGRAFTQVNDASIRAVKDGVAADILSHANGRTSFINDKFLQANGLTSKQAGNAASYVKDMQRLFEDGGQPTPKERQAMLTDGRYYDYLAVVQARSDELLITRDSIGQADATAHGAGMRLFTQFKNFSIGSMGYASKFGKDITEFKRYDRMMSLLGGLTVGGAYYVSNTAYKASFMDDRERRDYLEKNLSTEAIMLGALKRTPLLAGYSLGYDLFGTAASGVGVKMPYVGHGKNTFTEGYTDQSIVGNGGFNNMANNLAGMMPAWRTIGNVAKVGNSVLKTMTDDEMTRATSDRTTRIGVKALMALAPNSPSMQAGFSKLAEHYGVDLKAK